MKVELRNVTKVFPSRNKKSNEEVVAVSNCNFTIPDGKLIGLLGPSGCGKSTTLYIICGLQKPTGGQIFFGEDDVTDLAPENRGVGLVFQNYALYPHMTVKQNILFPLQNLKGADKLGKEEMLRRTLETARLVQIDELLDRKPSELSGGQQQRVAIARALVKMPRVLLLDEPLSALDRKVRAEMQYEIRNLQRQIGTTTVFVTHDQEEALTMSDQIILLHDGQIEQQGDPFTIYSQPASVFASDFLGKANLLSGVLACEDGVWCVCSENVRIPVNHVGGREGDTVKTAVRGEYFEFCTPETEGANPFHLEKKIFTGLSWKLIGTLGTQPLDISALGTHAGTLSEGDDLFVRIRPENVVYYNNN